jgi:mannose-1-phosphate guanylyltransferase
MRTCIVIMAGGRGERLWPRSTRKKPKQFQIVLGERTLLQQTFDRALNIGEAGDVYVATPLEYFRVVREQLPDLPSENIVVEPISMGTTATIGYSASYLKERMSEVVMVVLPSDHIVSDERKFKEAVDKAVCGARTGNRLITFGVLPTRPETAYGYVECGEGYGLDAFMNRDTVEADNDDNDHLMRVTRFTEKPSLDVATEFMQTGKHLWNAGIFAWKTSVIIDAIAGHAPEFGRALCAIKGLGFQSGATIESALADGADFGDWMGAATEIYAACGVSGPKSIDYAVMEKADKVFVVPVDFMWDDVGNWTAMERIRTRDGCGNAICGRVFALDSHSNIIENCSQDKVIVACGVRDLVIVNADDAILIMDKTQGHDIQKIRKAVMNKNDDRANN